MMFPELFGTVIRLERFITDLTAASIKATFNVNMFTKMLLHNADSVTSLIASLTQDRDGSFPVRNRLARLHLSILVFSRLQECDFNLKRHSSV